VNNIFTGQMPSMSPNQKHQNPGNINMVKSSLKHQKQFQVTPKLTTYDMCNAHLVTTLYFDNCFIIMLHPKQKVQNNNIRQYQYVCLFSFL